MANPNPVHRKGMRKKYHGPQAEVTAAVVMLHKPGAMTEQGRREISQWLRRTADKLIEEGGNYNNTGRFVARYLFEPKTLQKLIKT